MRRKPFGSSVNDYYCPISDAARGNSGREATGATKGHLTFTASFAGINEVIIYGNKLVLQLADALLTDNSSSFAPNYPGRDADDSSSTDFVFLTASRELRQT